MTEHVTPLTVGEILALPAAVPLWPDAARAFGVSRSLAYRMVQEDTWPTNVIHLGRLIKIPTAELRAVLGLRDDVAAPIETRRAS